MSAITPATSCSCLDVVTFPLRAPINALLWLADKVKQVYLRCIGFFVRIGVFMFGEYHRGFWQREVIEFFKKSPCDTNERSRFNDERLLKSETILKDLGGFVSHVWPKDGGARIEYYLVTYTDVRAKIEEKGGMWISIPARETEKGYVYDQKSPTTIEIICSAGTNTKWNDHYENTLKKVGWEETTLEFEGADHQVLLTTKWKDEKRLDPETLFLYSHSPTTSWAMDRGYAARHLSLHGSVCMYDPRGTWNSTGEASEGGYYNDARAVYDQMMRFGYKANKTVVSGFCLGGAVAADLKRTHPDTIYVPVNTFDSFERTMANQIFPFGFLGGTALEVIKDEGLDVVQDLFDTAGKLAKMRHDATRGATVQVATTTDTTIPDGATGNVFRAAERAGRVFQLFYTPDKPGNGHSSNPLDCPLFLEKYIEVLTRLIPEQALPPRQPSPPLQKARGPKESCARLVQDGAPPWAAIFVQPILVE